MNYTIEFTDRISPADDAKMSQDLVAYESSHGIAVNFKRVSVVIKDDQGAVFGALNAFTAFADIYVDDIWIETPYRRKGFGKKLLQALEERFKGKGFNNINLVTNAFQAPGFYEKCGFQVEFVRENKKNPKLTKTFFVKFFDEDIQMQGIVRDTKIAQMPGCKKTHPLIVGISGISGAGKSSLIRKLACTLQATALFWDEYDEISQGPQDYVKWFYSGKDYEAWIYTDLANTLSNLKEGQKVVCPATQRELAPTQYILFDAPLGYCHQATGRYIDFLIYLDTPPDIALARRLLRDYRERPDSQEMLDELEKYLQESRPLFILAPDEKASDLVIDGSLSLDQQEQEVLTALSSRRY